jgi:hypothetical protein
MCMKKGVESVREERVKLVRIKKGVDFLLFYIMGLTSAL